MGKIDIKELLEAGAHFGHKSSRWNPGMEPYIHSKRGGIHIIDLEKTAEELEKAAKFATEVAASGKQVLFVGTKKHIAPSVKEAAENARMPYVIERWFGGMLTNFTTISSRVKYYKKLDKQLEDGELEEDYNKREVLEFREQRDKLASDFAGIADMEELPGALFITDVITEKTAVREAKRLNIPIIAIVDTNGDPSAVDYVIPANDDAVKTVKLIADTISEAVQHGIKNKATKSDKSKETTKAKAANDKSKTAAKKKSTAKTETAKPKVTAKEEE